MADNGCGELNVAVAENNALELYQLAALLLGDQSEALNLVEETVGAIDIDPCADAAVAQELSRKQLVQNAIAKIHQADPLAFAVQPESDGSSSCIEDDDVASAGLSSESLAALLNGSGREKLRTWLDQLPSVQRAVFVERAILGRDNTATAQSLSIAARWTPEQVSQVFRQALCSLATSLVYSTAMKATA